MPLLDLSLVTQTFTSLLTEWIDHCPLKAQIGNFDVSALPPDKVQGKNTVHFYLYSIEENAQYKNVCSPVPDPRFPERFIPLGLDLHYQLTTHSDAANSAIPEQMLFGAAMKALHDYPLVDDATQIALKKVFPLDLQGTDNAFRVTLEPVPFNEAMQYWNAGNQPLRLAAYYMVTPVLLQPEKPDALRTRVLKYGVVSFPRGAPRIDACHAPVSFHIPGEAQPRTVMVQPAEAAVGSQITLTGNSLAGDATTLLINHRSFPAPVEVALDWGVAATPTTITAQIQSKAQLNTVVPGIYPARARVSASRTMPDGSTRTFANLSNETPFAVTPLIAVVSPPDAQGVIAVTGGVFADPAIGPDAVMVLLGGSALTLNTAGQLQPGEFEIASATSLRFRFPAAGFASGDTVMLRIVINGSENAPVWVSAP